MLLLPVLSLLSLSLPLAPGIMLDAPVVATVSQHAPSTEAAVPVAGTVSSTDWRGLVGVVSVLLTSLLVVRALYLRWRVLRLIERASAVAEPVVGELLKSLAGAVGLDRVPRLLYSSEVGTPVVLGCLSPVIILPAAWSRWSRKKVRAVLLHELSHVSRRDAWIMAAASWNAAVFWFNPLASWLHKRLRTLAEMACDDHTIMVVRDPEGYAETLLEIATCSHSGGALPATAPALARTPRVARRIERILRAPAFVSGILQERALQRLILIVSGAAILLSLVSVSVGQSEGVVLSGAVEDISGARIPGAIVRIVEQERDRTEATTTAADGSFRIEGMAPSADYEMEIRARGFAKYLQDLDLTADTELDSTLQVASIQEQLVVAGKRPPDSSRLSAARKQVHVGGNVQTAKLIEYSEPVYPEDAQEEGVEGTVLLEAVISTRGEPVGIEAVNTVVDPRLVTAAIEAVRK